MNNEQNELLRLEDLKNNPTPRVPVGLCLDNSASENAIVRGETQSTGRTVYKDGQTWEVVTGGVAAIEDLNEGVHALLEDIRSDEVAAWSAEISVVTFGQDSAKTVTPFTTVDRLDDSFTLTADGETYLGEGVNMTLDLLEQRKKEYQATGVDYYQPWLVLMTDGKSTGSPEELERAVSRVQSMVKAGTLTVFPLAVGKNPDMAVLQRFSPNRTPLKVRETRYRELFAWLTQSVVRTSQSIPGEAVELDTAGIKGWASL